MIILQKKIEKKDIYKKVSSESFSINKISSCSLFEFSLWDKFKKEIKQKNIKVGLEINSSKCSELKDIDFSYLKMIQINFESFKDGRPFTFVKKLRKENYFKGEVRAAGSILPDQFVFLIRSGFDTVKIPADDKDIWIELLDIDVGMYYQPWYNPVLEI